MSAFMVRRAAGNFPFRVPGYVRNSDPGNLATNYPFAVPLQNLVRWYWSMKQMKVALEYSLSRTIETDGPSGPVTYQDNGSISWAGTLDLPIFPEGPLPGLLAGSMQRVVPTLSWLSLNTGSASPPVPDLIVTRMGDPEYPSGLVFGDYAFQVDVDLMGPSAASLTETPPGNIISSDGGYYPLFACAGSEVGSGAVFSSVYNFPIPTFSNGTNGVPYAQVGTVTLQDEDQSFTAPLYGYSGNATPDPDTGAFYLPDLGRQSATSAAVAIEANVTLTPVYF